jgi:hypothetical protein
MMKLRRTKESREQSKQLFRCYCELHRLPHYLSAGKGLYGYSRDNI